MADDRKPIDVLLDLLARQDVKASEAEKALLAEEARLVELTPRDVLFSQSHVSNRFAIIVDGVLASEFIYNDEVGISRFFHEGEICANIESAVLSKFASDDIVAITKATVITLPLTRFEHAYMESNQLGVYFRRLMLANALESKKVIQLKSQFSTRARYEILSRDLAWVLERVPPKYIASFMGMLPDVFQQFLKKRNK